MDVLPGTGASLGAGRVRTDDGTWRDLLRPTAAAALGNPERCASFPMVPWSNRIEHGRLPFRGQEWQLQRNGADGTAIHGAVRHGAWTVAALSSDRVDLDLTTMDQVGTNFPWHFRARLTYALVGPSLVVTTTLHNIDAEPFPAGFGHHPYLSRALLPAGSHATAVGEPSLHVPATAGYALTGGIAHGAAGSVPARADYRTARQVGPSFVDDVLTGFSSGTRARVSYPAADGHGPVRVDVAADDEYGHLVLYVPRGRSYFAVEPVTHVNGGFALHDAGLGGTGVVVLAPGERLTASFTITVDG